MAITEVIRDQTRAPLLPVDESVVIPESVRRAAEAANAYYAPKPAGDAAPADAAPPADISPQPDPAPADPLPQPDPPPAPPADAAPAGDLPTPPGDPKTWGDWEKRYNSMKGRFEQSQGQVTQLQDTVTQLGDELMRVQAVVGNAPPAAPRAPAATKLLTDADVDNYGGELLDTIQRAALEAVTPKLTSLEQDNANLRKVVARTAGERVNATLDRDVPNWREINDNPKWKMWLRLRDLYSGEIRQRLLDKASQAADAPRIVAFFKGFINDEAAMGSTDLAPQPEPPAPPAPRTPAVPLESLTAPGRAKPAGGEQPSSAEKPVFTRAQIAEFYASVRRGAFVGREVEKDRQEREIFAAQREQRVR